LVLTLKSAAHFAHGKAGPKFEFMTMIMTVGAFYLDFKGVLSSKPKVSVGLQYVLNPL
jgi:hypothetical protein